MELAFLLRGVGAEVCWITNQKPSETGEVIYNLENKMLDRGVQVHHALLHYVNMYEIYLVTITVQNPYVYDICNTIRQYLGVLC